MRLKMLDDISFSFSYDRTHFNFQSTQEIYHLIHHLRINHHLITYHHLIINHLIMNHLIMKRKRKDMKEENYMMKKIIQPSQVDNK